MVGVVSVSSLLYMYRCWNTQSFHLVLYLRDLRMFVFIHGGHSQHPYKSLCQSTCPCMCLVHQVIVHEVPGQELEVEVYDKDPDQDDFLGRYIVHVSLCV